MFGSITKSLKPRDIDIAVSFIDRNSYAEMFLDLYADLLEALEFTKLPLDLVPIDSSTPCELVLEVFRGGVLVYEHKKHSYLDDITKRVMICYDWFITEKRLGVIETAEKVAMSGGNK